MKDEQSQSRSETAKLRGEQSPPRRLSFLQASVAVMLTLAVIAAIVIPFLDDSLLDMAELSARSFLGDADAIATVEAGGQASSANPGLQQIAGPVYARPGATGTPLQEAEVSIVATPTIQLAPGAIQLPTATPAPEEDAVIEASPTVENSPTITPTLAAIEEPTAEMEADETEPAQPLDTAAAILNADNILVSADAQVLRTLVRDNEYAVGLLDNSFVEDDLRIVSLALPDGTKVKPSLNSVSQGAYPLTQDLYLYTTGATLQNNPTATAFMGCYLVHVQDEWAASGLYPAIGEDFDNSLALYEVMTGYAGGQLLRSCLTADDVTASVTTRNAANLIALTQAIAEQAASDGFAGEVQIETVTSEDGAWLCSHDDGSGMDSEAADLLMLDTPLPAAERQFCEDAGMEPLEFIIGQSAAALVVSADNTFADNVTIGEAYALLSNATSWSDVRNAWPDAPITRAVADPQSGTFGTFVAAVSTAGESELAAGDSGSDSEGTVAVATSTSATGGASTTATEVLTPTASTSDANVSDVNAEDAGVNVVTSTTDMTETVAISSPTSIAATDVVTPSSTSTDTLAATPSPAPTVMPSGDLVMGMVDERDACAFVADILIEVFAERFELDVVSVSFDTIEELYIPLLGSATEDASVDLTLCQMDPADRELLRIKGDAVALIGSTYASNDGQRYLVVANADAATELRREQSCAYEFLSKMNFGDLSELPLEPTEWLAQNSDLIDEWTLCAGEEE